VSVVAPELVSQVFNIKASQLTTMKVLGEGSFGKVYFGMMDTKPVAIKKTNMALLGAQVSDFFREASLMLAIPPHRNVVRVYGICQEYDNLAIVMEYCEKGSLKSFISSPEGANLTPEQQRMILLGTAEGLRHISSHQIVHRDVALRNILLDQNLQPRVADFGFGRKVGDDGRGNTKSDVGPIRWYVCFLI
jgi:serine/threonine protein kinase